MTRYPRRRSHSRTLDGSPFRAPIAAGIRLDTNPNTGYRKISNPALYRLTEDGAPQRLLRIPSSI